MKPYKTQTYNTIDDEVDEEEEETTVFRCPFCYRIFETRKDE